MKNRKAKRKYYIQHGETLAPDAKKEFVNLIARLIMDITLEQVKDRNKKT